ncbi:MAG: asparaginase [Rubrobacteraceae bacterium]
MTNVPEDTPLIALKRGELVESVHRGRFVVCDPQGDVLEAAGNVEAYFYPRSALKPFQAMPLVLSGAADEFGLSDEELAVACASHGGEERHVEAVSSLLHKAGLSEDDLDNGAHPPMHGPSAEALVQRGESFRQIHGNCSGKHAGMVAVCVCKRWDMSGYRAPDHPLQRWVLSLVATVCDLKAEEIITGGDGCGAPAFAMPVKNFATGFARLATGEELPEDIAGAASRLRLAMRNHPSMIAGTGRFDTEVLEKTDLIVKGGADGVWAAGSEEGWGLALKVSDGARRAARSAATAVLRGRGIDLESEDGFPVRDLHGEEVGEMVSLSVSADSG